MSIAKTHNDALPAGFEYRPGLLDADSERDLLTEMRTLDFRNFDFHGYQGKRRVVYFGWRYEFGPGALQKADEISQFLLPLRDRAATFAELSPAALPHVLVTEYEPRAPIGWHRDKVVFGEVIGISLYSSCTLRFRKKHETGWQRASLRLEPRSAYVLRGPARTEWSTASLPSRSCATRSHFGL